MNIVKIYEICGDKNQMLEKLVEWGLIPQSGTYNCMDCGQALKLRSEEDRVDGFRWTCHGNKKTQNKKKAKRCDKRVGFRTGTFFARSHLPIWKILGFVNFWVQGASLRLTGLQLELAQEALVDWSSFCREVILASYFGRLEKIGGPGKIVEIDESKFGKARYMFLKSCKERLQDPTLEFYRLAGLLYDPRNQQEPFETSEFDKDTTDEDDFGDL